VISKTNSGRFSPSAITNETGDSDKLEKKLKKIVKRIKEQVKTLRQPFEGN
jgi:uncharacterized protein YukE